MNDIFHSRAARITFLIISTCTVGWIPAVVNFLLVCPSDCEYKPSDLSAETLFAMHAVGYVLVILKSLANPLIFALRQSHIKAAIQGGGDTGAEMEVPCQLNKTH